MLATITMFFGLLLITVLLSVSTNQRLGEIPALRALGFSQKRMVSDVLWRSALLVGSGGLVALPLGLALSIWLEGYFKQSWDSVELAFLRVRAASADRVHRAAGSDDGRGRRVSDVDGRTAADFGDAQSQVIG